MSGGFVFLKVLLVLVFGSKLCTTELENFPRKSLSLDKIFLILFTVKCNRSVFYFPGVHEVICLR